MNGKKKLPTAAAGRKFCNSTLIRHATTNFHKQPLKAKDIISQILKTEAQKLHCISILNFFRIQQRRKLQLHLLTTQDLLAHLPFFLLLPFVIAFHLTTYIESIQ